MAETKPGLSYPVQWVALGAGGGGSASFCVCADIPMWPSESAITSVTPDASVPTEYGPKPGDYFFLTLAAPDAPPASAPFARFTVTR